MKTCTKCGAVYVGTDDQHAQWCETRKNPHIETMNRGEGQPVTEWQRLMEKYDDGDAMNTEMIRVLKGLIARECKHATEDEGFLTDDEVSVIQTIIEDKRG